MITGELKSKVDKIWETLWSGGISNPLSVIEQLTYLLFIKRLDEVHTLAERKANRTGKPIDNPVFADGEQHLRWKNFKELAPEPMFDCVRDAVFPFIKNLGKAEAGKQASSFHQHMQDAIFMMPTPRVLANVVDQLDDIDMSDADTKGDLYEYMLGKIATAGQNGQFRTPRHIIELMVDMMHPKPSDKICDPACGSAGFLVAAASYLKANYSGEIYKDQAARDQFNNDTLFGYDFDNTMLRIGSMNLQLHGVENPDIRYKDSLAQIGEGADESDEEKYSLILANPPFKGSLDYESTAKDLLQVVKTKKTELLFMALFLRQLQVGGRAAVIVPDGVLFGSSKAHKTLRKILVEDNKLDGVISMPSGVFKPYAGVSTAILLFTKVGRAGAGGTENVWFYDMQSDGYSLDDKRTKLDNSDLPDILARWQSLGFDSAQPAANSAQSVANPSQPAANPSQPAANSVLRPGSAEPQPTDRTLSGVEGSGVEGGEADRQRTEQSFLVPKSEIADNDYDLSINRYKEVVYEAVEYDPPQEILARLHTLEQKISQGKKQLGEMLASAPLSQHSAPYFDQAQ